MKGQDWLPPAQAQSRYLWFFVVLVFVLDSKLHHPSDTLLHGSALNTGKWGDFKKGLGEEPSVLAPCVPAVEPSSEGCCVWGQTDLRPKPVFPACWGRGVNGPFSIFSKPQLSCGDGLGLTTVRFDLTIFSFSGCKVETVLRVRKFVLFLADDILYDVPSFHRDAGWRHQAAAPSRPATPGEQPTLRCALGGQCVLEVVFCVSAFHHVYKTPICVSRF